MNPLLRECLSGVMIGLTAIAFIEIMRGRWPRAKALIGCILAIAAGVVVGVKMLHT